MQCSWSRQTCNTVKCLLAHRSSKTYLPSSYIDDFDSPAVYTYCRCGMGSPGFDSRLDQIGNFSKLVLVWV